MGCERQSWSRVIRLANGPTAWSGGQGETPALFTETSPRARLGRPKLGGGTLHSPPQPSPFPHWGHWGRGCCPGIWGPSTPHHSPPGCSPTPRGRSCSVPLGTSSSGSHFSPGPPCPHLGVRYGFASPLDTGAPEPQICDSVSPHLQNCPVPLGLPQTCGISISAPSNPPLTMCPQSSAPFPDLGVTWAPDASKSSPTP